MAKKVPVFYDGDPDDTKFFGPAEKLKPSEEMVKKEKEWVKKRDAARKNPPPYALVQNPSVYK